MKNWNNIKNGDMVKCIIDESVYEVVVWREEKYLSGKKDMWNINQFDSREFELVKE